MKIIFDTTKELPIDAYRENVSNNTLNASLDMEITEETELPELEPFKGMTEFSSVSIVDGEKEMPIVCEYNRLELTASYSDAGKYFHLSAALHKEETA